MNPSLVREIADQIVREQILGNWWFYLLLLSLTIVAGAVGSFAPAYFKKRAETFATKADLQEVLAQLKETTKVTEQVRAEISHADWVTREWRTIRRTKLEELLATAYALERWLDDQQHKWIYKEPRESANDPLDRLNLLGTLYFPELRPEIDAVLSAHHSSYQFILQIASEVGPASNDPKAYQAIMSKFVDGWKPLSSVARPTINVLAKRSAEVMRSLAEA